LCVNNNTPFRGKVKSKEAEISEKGAGGFFAALMDGNLCSVNGMRRLSGRCFPADTMPLKKLFFQGKADFLCVSACFFAVSAV
jgi:hypothetical protein